MLTCTSSVSPSYNTTQYKSHALWVTSIIATCFNTSWWNDLATRVNSKKSSHIQSESKLWCQCKSHRNLFLTRKGVLVLTHQYKGTDNRTIQEQLGDIITQSNGRMCCHSQQQQIDGLVQERRNSSVLAMELRPSCTNPSGYPSIHNRAYQNHHFFWCLELELWPMTLKN